MLSEPLMEQRRVAAPGRELGLAPPASLCELDRPLPPGQGWGGTESDGGKELWLPPQAAKNPEPRIVSGRGALGEGKGGDCWGPGGGLGAPIEPAG